MPVEKLATALNSINWSSNVQIFLADNDQATTVASANLRIAIWAKQFENADSGNPALCFVREMQMAGQHVAALIALALYKPAAASMRAMFEAGLYYSYFRTHQSELQTLVRDTSFYVDKNDVLDFHKLHTLNYHELAQTLGVTSRLKDWHSKISAVIHGQIPGAWIEHKSLAETAPIKDTQKIAVEEFRDGEEILHRFFLCATGRMLWDSFSSSAKQKLLHGLTGNLKAALALDAS